MISTFAAAARILINYSKEDYFSSESLKQNKVLSLPLDLKNTLYLQYGKLPSIVCLCFVLKSSDVLPIYDKMQVNLLLKTNEFKAFFDKKI